MALASAANQTIPSTPGDGLGDTRLNSTVGSPSRIETANDSQRPIKKPEKKLDPYIRKNIEESPTHFKTLDYDGKRYELQERIKMAKDRKSDMEAEKRKMNIIWIHKWALIKEKREEMERICNNIRMIKQRKTLYVKNMLAYHINKKIYEVFDEKRSAVLLEMKINFAVFQFGLGLKRFLRKKGPNREARSRRQMRRCFAYIGNAWVSLKE
jgi:hypothetical protein